MTGRWACRTYLGAGVALFVTIAVSSSYGRAEETPQLIKLNLKGGFVEF
jgi:hypothetical protein